MAESKGSSTKRVTMQDIAQAAGVSQTTVSFILNRNKEVGISEATRHKVLATAKALGYTQRRGGAGRQREGLAPFIGFMIDEIATSVFAALSIEAAQEAAWNAGYILDLAMTSSNKDYEERVLTRWLEDGVTGVIYGSILTRQVHPPALLSEANAVLLNAYSDLQNQASNSFPAIIPAEVMGGFAATEALIQRGCRRIAFIGGEEWMEAAADRQQGYRNALATYQYPLKRAWLKAGNFMPSGGYAATVALLQDKPRPDGIFCANDLMAVGAYEAIKEAGLRIPEDIAVVGYDDQEIAGHLNPPLSTILLPHRDMGRWAVDLLLQDKKQASLKSQTFRLECPYVPRASC